MELGPNARKHLEITKVDVEITESSDTEGGVVIALSLLQRADLGSVGGKADKNKCFSRRSKQRRK